MLKLPAFFLQSNLMSILLQPSPPHSQVNEPTHFDVLAYTIFSQVSTFLPNYF
jgi:hypothetical protein